MFGKVTGVSFSLSPPHCGVIIIEFAFAHSKLDLKSHKFFSEFFSFNLLVKSSIDSDQSAPYISVLPLLTYLPDHLSGILLS